MDDISRKWIENEILFTNEVAHILGCSRQYVNTLVVRDKIRPIKSIPGNNLFLRSDIEEYIATRKLSNITVPRKIWSTGSTYKTKMLLKEKISGKGKIVSIYLYFYAMDAIKDGFYGTKEIAKRDSLMGIDTPTLVIKFEDLTELWFRDLVPGYYGTSPTATYELLLELDIPEEIAKKVFDSRWIKIYRSGLSWDSIAENRYTEEEQEVWDRMQNGDTPQYIYNNNFVALDEWIHRTWLNRRPVEFYKQHLNFIDEPVSISILTREYAIETGHYIYSSAGNQYYNVVIKGNDGNEIWIYCPIDERKDIGNQVLLQELFEVLDVKLSLANCTFDKFRRWVGKPLPVYYFKVGREKDDRR